MKKFLPTSINEFLSFQEELTSLNESSDFDQITEAEISDEADAAKLMKDLESIFMKTFPNSLFQARFANQFGSSISMRLRLGNSKKDWPNGIIDNDILTADFFVNGYDREGNATGPLELEAIRGVSWLTIPDNKYMAYGRQKVPFRKVKGNEKKIAQGFQKTLDKIKQSIKDNMDKIPDGHDYVKNKI